MLSKKKFLITRPIGGIGNQIFQFFFSALISQITSRELVIYNSRFILFKKSKPYLYNIVSKKYKNTFKKNYSLLNFFLSFKFFAKYYYDQDIFNIPDILTKNIKNDCSKYLVIDGYWQSFKLLDKLTSKEFFKFLSPSFFCNGSKKKYNDICVHIRRGDYYNDKKVKKIHGILKFNYFINSMNMFKKKFGDKVNFFIFSDDIQFCKNLYFLKNRRNISFFDSSDDLLNFKEMSKFQNYILSNSTFGLLSAYISARKKGNINISIPDKWMKNIKTNSTELVSQYFTLI